MAVQEEAFDTSAEFRRFDANRGPEISSRFSCRIGKGQLVAILCWKSEKHPTESRYVKVRGPLPMADPHAFLIEPVLRPVFLKLGAFEYSGRIRPTWSRPLWADAVEKGF